MGMDDPRGEMQRMWDDALPETRKRIDVLEKKNGLLEEEIRGLKEAHEELSRQYNYSRSLIENTLDIITVLDREGRICYVTPSTQRVMGYEPEELMGREISEYIHPDNQSAFRVRILKAARVEGVIDSSEFQMRHKDGSWRYLENHARKITPEGEEPYIIVNSRDVTEKVLARQKLKKSKEQLAMTQEIARLGSWEWDLETNRLRWSRVLSRVYGIDHQKAPATILEVLPFIHPDDRRRVEEKFLIARMDEAKLDLEFRIVRPDGGERIKHVRGEPIHDERGRMIRMIGTGQDVTELKKAEQKLREYSEQLRNLSARQDRVREDDRIRFAKQVHDELGQMLAVLKMELFMMKERVREEYGERLAGGVVREISRIIERFDTIIDSAQRITTELRPEVLDTLGLNEAIEWQCREFERETGMEISYVGIVESIRPIDNERSTAIFRILQETLSNIRKHAEATRVEIQLKKDEQNIVLMVHDNGKGIPKDKLTSPDSLGIIGMYERSQFLGGDIIFSGNQEGTTMILKIPVKIV